MRLFYQSRQKLVAIPTDDRQNFSLGLDLAFESRYNMKAGVFHFDYFLK